MKNRVRFSDRLRWLCVDVRSSNPCIVSGLWHCHRFSPGDILRLHIGDSRIDCAQRVEEHRPDGSAVLRFAASVKSRPGWKFLRFCRESPGRPPRVVASRLLWMPSPLRLRALRKYRQFCDQQAAELAAIPVPDDGPLVSVLMPVFNPPPDCLTKAIASLRAQTCPRWELCIVDDASTDPKVGPFLRDIAGADPRIKLTTRAVNGHISAATNSALAMAGGEWCALLDQDDEFSPHTITAFLQTLREHPDAQLIYSDEDKIDEHGRFHGAYHKPKWMPELLLGQNVVSHLGFYRTGRLRAVGGFRIGFEGCQDWDLVLRYTEDLPAKAIVHLPFVLYHWRCHPGSTAQSTAAKPYIVPAAERTVRSALRKRGQAARLDPLCAGQFKVSFVPSARPLVTLVSLEGDLDEARLRAATDYDQLEFAVAAPSRGRGYRRLWDVARAATAPIIASIPSHALPRQRDWLDRLVGALSCPGVAASGGSVTTLGFRVVDGSLVLDDRGHPRPAFQGELETAFGYFGRAQLLHNPGGLSLRGICLWREHLLEIPAECVDDATSPAEAGWTLCSRLRSSGQRVIHDPGVRWDICPRLTAAPARTGLTFPATDDPSLHRPVFRDWPPPDANN